MPEHPEPFVIVRVPAKHAEAMARSHGGESMRRMYAAALPEAEAVERMADIISSDCNVCDGMDDICDDCIHRAKEALAALFPSPSPETTP